MQFINQFSFRNNTSFNTKVFYYYELKSFCEMNFLVLTPVLCLNRNYTFWFVMQRNCVNTGICWAKLRATNRWV